MGSPTFLHFQCSVGNTILLFIPCTELRISANDSPYGCLGFVIKSTLNILSARGLAHSERQRNVKNVALRNAELHNTKKAIYFPTSKITFIKHPKKKFFCPVANRSFSARSARKTGCSLRGLSSCNTSVFFCSFSLLAEWGIRCVHTFSETRIILFVACC